MTLSANEAIAARQLRIPMMVMGDSDRIVMGVSDA